MKTVCLMLLSSSAFYALSDAYVNLHTGHFVWAVLNVFAVIGIIFTAVELGYRYEVTKK